MLFGDGLVRSLELFFCAKVDVDCLGVGVGTIDGITEVHDEEVGGRTRMEWVDQSLRLGSSLLMLSTREAQFLRWEHMVFECR